MAPRLVDSGLGPFIVTFSALKVASSDEQEQCAFVQRLYGDASRALSYFFGLGLLEALFYAHRLRGFVALVLAGLIDAVPRAAVTATIASAWSLFLAFELVIVGGTQYLDNTPGGGTDLALVPVRTHTSVGAYL